MISPREPGDRMHDPHEGITPEGLIVTGASRSRIPPAYEALLDAATGGVISRAADASLYVYGSVATGTALVPDSDVDLVSIGLPPIEAEQLSRDLSDRFGDLCRSVHIGPAQPSDYLGEGDEAYGNRVFLSHYCVHLGGPDHHTGLPDFAADSRAARGFNGDIAQHAERWRTELAAGLDPSVLSRRIGRKSLHAVAGLVSVRDHTWTTDRRAAAVRWAEVEPALTDALQALLKWSRGEDPPDLPTVEIALDGVVAEIVDSFAAEIGLWDPPSD